MGKNRQIIPIEKTLQSFKIQRVITRLVGEGLIAAGVDTSTFEILHYIPQVGGVEEKDVVQIFVVFNLSQLDEVGADTNGIYSYSSSYDIQILASAAAQVIDDININSAEVVQIKAQNIVSQIYEIVAGPQFRLELEDLVGLVGFVTPSNFSFGTISQAVVDSLASENYSITLTVGTIERGIGADGVDVEGYDWALRPGGV